MYALENKAFEKIKRAGKKAVGIFSELYFFVGKRGERIGLARVYYRGMVEKILWNKACFPKMLW